jgi:hypothetical protein
MNVTVTLGEKDRPSTQPLTVLFDAPFIQMEVNAGCLQLALFDDELHQTSGAVYAPGVWFSADIDEPPAPDMLAKLRERDKRADRHTGMYT